MLRTRRSNKIARRPAGKILILRKVREYLTNEIEIEMAKFPEQRDFSRLKIRETAKKFGLNPLEISGLYREIYRRYPEFDNFLRQPAKGRIPNQLKIAEKIWAKIIERLNEINNIPPGERNPDELAGLLLPSRIAADIGEGVTTGYVAKVYHMMRKSGNAYFLPKFSGANRTFGRVPGQEPMAGKRTNMAAEPAAGQVDKGYYREPEVPPEFMEILKRTILRNSPSKASWRYMTLVKTAARMAGLKPKEITAIYLYLMRRPTYLIAAEIGMNVKKTNETILNAKKKMSEFLGDPKNLLRIRDLVMKDSGRNPADDEEEF